MEPFWDLEFEVAPRFLKNLWTPAITLTFPYISYITRRYVFSTFLQFSFDEGLPLSPEVELNTSLTISSAEPLGSNTTVLYAYTYNKTPNGKQPV
jgi:hypothetical protein